MKSIIWLFTLVAASAWAAPSVYVENTTEYSAYYTRQQAAGNLRSFNGCTNQAIGSIIFEDCSAKIKSFDGETELPAENDKDFRCHFEYQSYNPSFFKILLSNCL